MTLINPVISSYAITKHLSHCMVSCQRICIVWVIPFIPVVILPFHSTDCTQPQIYLSILSKYFVLQCTYVWCMYIRIWLDFIWNFMAIYAWPLVILYVIIVLSFVVNILTLWHDSNVMFVCTKKTEVKCWYWLRTFSVKLCAFVKCKMFGLRISNSKRLFYVYITQQV